MNFKNIHIGNLIFDLVKENEIGINRICNYFDISEKQLLDMFKMKSMDSELLLMWSKILHYDLFRIYTQHLILYAPTGKMIKSIKKQQNIPVFKKNIYTKGIIDFILEQLRSGEMTKKEVIEKYNIPKTTLYKWIDKY